MPKVTKKTVDLIRWEDYPKDKYSAYWEIMVQGDDEIGYVYKVRILSYTPAAWKYNGKTYDEKPDVVEHPTTPPPEKCTKQQWDEWYQKYIKILASNPAPIYVLQETEGAVMERDEADTIAQTFVMDNIEKYRIPEPAEEPDS